MIYRVFTRVGNIPIKILSSTLLQSVVSHSVAGRFYHHHAAYPTIAVRVYVNLRFSEVGTAAAHEDPDQRERDKFLHSASVVPTSIRSVQ